MCRRKCYSNLLKNPSNLNFKLFNRKQESFVNRRKDQYFIDSLRFSNNYHVKLLLWNTPVRIVEGKIQCVKLLLNTPDVCKMVYDYVQDCLHLLSDQSVLLWPVLEPLFIKQKASRECLEIWGNLWSTREKDLKADLNELNMIEQFR